MSSATSARLITSRYNFRVPIEGGVLLYNANTGSLLRVDGDDADDVASLLTGHEVEVDPNDFPESFFGQLVEGGFFVDADADEVATIRERYWSARRDTPMVLTITTTMDCNLGCYYCYEERSTDRLEVRDVDAIVRLAEQRLDRSGKKRLHVDWYGGEPLMNLAFMEAASEALQAMCRARDCKYVASVVSNGTCWPDEIEAFVARHKLGEIQISFDGMRENHDKRRRYRKGYAENPDDSSFDKAVALVDRLLNCAHVDIRMNIDRGNADDISPFIAFARQNGWFARPFKAKIQPARLASYTPHSSFMRKYQLTDDEYKDLRELVRTEVNGETPVEEGEVPDGYPYPRNTVCAALADASVIVGADKRHYRCGLQVAEPGRSVGQLPSAGNSFLPIIDLRSGPEPDDSLWWKSFDPTTLPTCSKCSFLPICWAGCPVKQLERDEFAIAEQGRYWRKNLPRLVTQKFGLRPVEGFEFDKRDQFRSDD